MITIRRKYEPEDTFLGDLYFKGRKYENEKFVRTDIYFPENIDRNLVYNLWNLKSCRIGKTNCLRITLDSLALRKYEVEEITEEWDIFKASANFFFIEDGIDIHRVLRGVPCFLLKMDFEIVQNRRI